MTQEELDKLKTELLDRIAEGGIDGVDLLEVIDELNDEYDCDGEDEISEAIDMAADELRGEGRITDEGCSGCRLSYGEIADRVLGVRGRQGPDHHGPPG